MTRIAKLYARFLANPRGHSFREFEQLVGAFGFVELRQRGSHRTFRHPARIDLLVIQPRGKDAKDYQVREFLDMVRESGLELEE
jgi:predicted RNA binding protein YcfA (HicA-like mRNA interferase family)